MATEKVTIPDFGDVQEITVVEIYVSVGSKVEPEEPLIALESEKAVMDIPSPAAGTVKEIYLEEDSSVKSGDTILLLETEAETEESDGQTVSEELESLEPPEPEKLISGEEQDKSGEQSEKSDTVYHASPSVRSYARELGIDLGWISATGPKGRITRADLVSYIKSDMNAPAAVQNTSLFMESQPLEDFSQYGDVEEKKLGRIKKVSGPHLHKSWVSIPHVTHFDEADVTDLESFRKQMNAETGNGLKFSPLVFIVKAVVATLKEFSIFNCSLDQQKSTLILKYFYNIGIAVDTPNGLVVPVIKSADKKGMKEIAVELRDLSEAARAGKLGIDDMQGATFTISSLGGIGGTAFTPIINSPQVAILGLSRNYMKPVWNDDEQIFRPRLTLPFSLSYDHRVIDGADAARFCRALSQSIEDLRRALL